MPYLVYRSIAEPSTPGEAAARPLPPGYSMETWHPDWRHIVPPTLGPKFALWWLLHLCGMFRNRDYSVLIVRQNGRAVHRSCLIPKYFRWPFMANRDLQVSSTWTHPAHRCRGLATYALQTAVAQWAIDGRTLWYVTHADNAPSLTVCRNMAFRLKSAATRTSRFGIRLLGELVLTPAYASAVSTHPRGARTLACRVETHLDAWAHRNRNRD